MTDRRKLVPVILLMIFIIPSAIMASAQTADDGGDLDIPGDIIPAGPAGPVGTANELLQAHSDISGIMTDHSNRDYSVADEFVFTMTYVDEQNEKLVVMLDPILLSLGLHYDEGDIEDLLGTEKISIDVTYGVFVPEDHIRPSSQSKIDSWIALYNSRCASPTDNALCEALTFNLGTQNHYTLDSNNTWHPPAAAPPEQPDPPPAAAPPTAGTSPANVFFSDDFEDGTLDKWTESGEPDWRADAFDERSLPPGHASTNKVAEADNCDTPCIITTTSPMNITGIDNPRLEFWRYVDRSIDNYDDGEGEYLKAEVTTDGAAWTQLDLWTEENGDDDDAWHRETYDLAPYSSAAFQVRFVALASSPAEDVGIDSINVTTTSQVQTPPSTPEPEEDATPPTITTPGDITREQRHSTLGSFIEFDVTATDDTDGEVDATCDRETGWYTAGTYTVTCTASDAAGNTSTARFTITVTSPASSTPTDSDGDGYHDGIDQCPSEASSTNYGCPSEPEPPLTNQTIPVYAGVDHGYSYEFLGPHITQRGPYYGTIGFTGYTVNGTAVFIGAAHTFVPDKFSGQEPVIHSNKHIIFPIGHPRSVVSTGSPMSDYFMYQPERTIDAALVPITNDTFVPSNQLKMRNGTIIDLLQGNTTSVERGSEISLYGSRTNSDGVLLFKNATVTTRDYGKDRPYTYTIPNYLIGNYASVGGDSGGPVVIHQNGSAHIIGIHSGVVCQFVSPSENQPEINFWFNATDNSPLCPQVTTGIWTYYKGFSSWNTVKSELGIR